MLEVKPTGQHSHMATGTDQNNNEAMVPLHKHWLGSCTTHIPPLNCHITSPCDTMFSRVLKEVVVKKLEAVSVS